MKSLVSITLLALVFVLLSYNVSAQAWQEIIVMKTDGDTLKGESRFFDADISPSELVFRENPESRVTTLTTEDIRSFELPRAKKVFETLKARIAILFSTPIPSGTSPVAGREDIKVFADVLVIGRGITLYSVHDRNRDERFFIRKDNELTELTNLEYQIDKGGLVYKAKEPRYRGELKQLFGDCPSSTAGSIGYDARSFSKVVLAYLSCRGTSSSFQQDQTAGRFGVGIFGELLASGEVGGWLAGISGQILSRKNEGNRFAWLNLGYSYVPEFGSFFYGDVFAGSYMGRGKVQPLVGVGVSTIKGAFFGGAGLAYRKNIVLSYHIHLYTGSQIVSSGNPLTAISALKFTVFTRLPRE